MKYTYLEIIEPDYDTRLAKLERQLCAIRLIDIARHTRTDYTTIQHWESGGRKIAESRGGTSYRTITRAIHTHASLDYWPCPTLIKLAPDKWTNRLLMLMAERAEWYE
jgi:hypothetical protein